jgi:hypothetical protein
MEIESRGRSARRCPATLYSIPGPGRRPVGLRRWWLVGSSPVICQQASRSRLDALSLLHILSEMVRLEPRCIEPDHCVRGLALN